MGDKPCLHQCHHVGGGLKGTYVRAGSFVSISFNNTKFYLLKFFYSVPKYKDCIF